MHLKGICASLSFNATRDFKQNLKTKASYNCNSTNPEENHWRHLKVQKDRNSCIPTRPIKRSIPEDSFFIGGELTKGKFVRLTLEHIAINFKDFGVERGDAMSKKFLAFVGEVLKERFEPKGWRWEFNILETDRKLWRVQSIEPPPLNSDAMKVWDREQKGVEWRENFDAAFD
ncbi:hypothetical protein G7Y89_g10199 [Cudoniella acicularis]|uniref:Tautomerase cis-CaaD-like domain-containing protein n=1 Tax=Cudoniella acicularis TaxID=354080 RepID=A0A8H4VZF8_9HELO|nr:hypothetical protein G7Y89_g10199 [Cudoniella acicularis]